MSPVGLIGENNGMMKELLLQMHDVEAQMNYTHASDITRQQLHSRCRGQLHSRCRGQLHSLVSSDAPASTLTARGTVSVGDGVGEGEWPAINTANAALSDTGGGSSCPTCYTTAIPPSSYPTPLLAHSFIVGPAVMNKHTHPSLPPPYRRRVRSVVYLDSSFFCVHADIRG